MGTATWELQWAATRALVLRRDGHRCRRCSSRDRLSAHHIKPRDQGGFDDLRNLVTLCAEIETAENGLTWAQLLQRPPREEDLRLWYRDRHGRVSCLLVGDNSRAELEDWASSLTDQAPLDLLRELDAVS